MFQTTGKNKCKIRLKNFIRMNSLNGPFWDFASSTHNAVPLTAEQQKEESDVNLEAQCKVKLLQGLWVNPTYVPRAADRKKNVIIYQAKFYIKRKMHHLKDLKKGNLVPWSP